MANVPPAGQQGNVEYWEVYYAPSAEQAGRFGGPLEDSVLTVVATSVQGARAAAEKQLGNSAAIASIQGPYNSQAAASASGAAGAAAQGKINQSGKLPSLLPSFSLIVQNIAPWFFRGLKILFGGVLLVLGISHLTGADNAVTQLAGKVPVLPV